MWKEYIYTEIHERFAAERARREEKLVPVPVPLYTWVVPLNQLIWVECGSHVWTKVTGSGPQGFMHIWFWQTTVWTIFTNTFYSNRVYGLRHPALRETWSLSPAFCKIYQMGHVSRSSCFYSSAVKCTCLPSTGYGWSLEHPHLR